MDISTILLPASILFQGLVMQLNHKRLPWLVRLAMAIPYAAAITIFVAFTIADVPDVVRAPVGRLVTTALFLVCGFASMATRRLHV